MSISTEEVLAFAVTPTTDATTEEELVITPTAPEADIPVTSTNCSDPPATLPTKAEALTPTAETIADVLLLAESKIRNTPLMTRCQRSLKPC
jgi:hypothetical protein